MSEVCWECLDTRVVMNQADQMEACPRCRPIPELEG